MTMASTGCSVVQEREDSICITSSQTSTATEDMTTTATTTTTSMTTTTVATTTTTVRTEPMMNISTEPMPTAEIVTCCTTIPIIYNEEAETDIYISDLPITENERILLCNLVGREYGADYIPVEEKAKVVATVMNRINSDEYPDTIYDVVTQPYQFEGYIPYDEYTYQVTDSVIESVDYYFEHADEFGDYMYFYGDGQFNYFY